METKFVVTPWRNADELFQLRKDFYNRDYTNSNHDRRQQAVNRVLAWKIRKQELPLLLESTADIVEAILQDERGELAHNALRLVYATAISRFITGFTDTQLDLRRSKPSWFPTDVSRPFLDLPTHLRETRHSIVHRHLPSLAELKRSAQESLDWLWEWYWSHLDTALSPRKVSRDTPTTEGDIRDRIQAILKTYVRTRKAHLKSGKSKNETQSQAAATIASSSLFSIFALNATAHQNVLLDLLVHDKQIIPADRKVGDNMSGAFLIWSPLLSLLSISMRTFLENLIERLMRVINGAWADPVKEAMVAWIVHIFTSSTFEHPAIHREQLLDKYLQVCFTSPTAGNLRIAEVLLAPEFKAKVQGWKYWKMVLEAAKDEGMEVEMDVDTTVVTQAGQEGEKDEIMSEENDVVEVEQRMSGPQKWVGLWRPTPIGALPDGYDDDE